MRVAWLVVATRPDIKNSKEKRAVGRFTVATIGELRHLCEGYLCEFCNDYTSLTRSETATWGSEVARDADPSGDLVEFMGRLDLRVLDASA